MSSNTITLMSKAVGAGATINVQPPSGEAWKITDIFSDLAFVSGVPDVEVSFKKGANSAIALIDPTTDPGKRGRQYEFYITNTVYLTVKNTGAGAANITVIGKKVNANNVVSDLVAIGAGATIDVQPPATYDMKVTEIGCSVWKAGPADINPDVQIYGKNGTLNIATIIDPTMVRGQDKQLAIYISNSVYLGVKDTGGAGSYFAYSAIKSEYPVVSVIEDIATGDDLDLVPADGNEYQVTEIGAETWTALGAPDDYPDIVASIVDVADLSDVLEAAASLRWNSPCILLIDNSNPLKINNSSAGDSQIFVSAIFTRQYNP